MSSVLSLCWTEFWTTAKCVCVCDERVSVCLLRSTGCNRCVVFGSGRRIRVYRRPRSSPWLLGGRPATSWKSNTGRLFTVMSSASNKLYVCSLLTVSVTSSALLVFKWHERLNLNRMKWDFYYWNPVAPLSQHISHCTEATCFLHSSKIVKYEVWINLGSLRILKKSRS